MANAVAHSPTHPLLALLAACDMRRRVAVGPVDLEQVDVIDA
jgi:hypothetical protein